MKCPNCGTQHDDLPRPDQRLCHCIICGHVWDEDHRRIEFEKNKFLYDILEEQRLNLIIEGIMLSIGRVAVACARVITRLKGGCK
jgi:hypothetical protein